MHPAVDTKIGNDLRAVTYISRSFMNTETCLDSIEQDIGNRLKGFIKSGRLPVRVSEMSPFRLTEQEKLEQKAKAEPAFADYLTTWDHDLVSRMTIVDEDIDDPETVIAVGYEDMPPTDFMLRYYVREYEDGLDLPPSTLLPPHTEMVH